MFDNALILASIISLWPCKDLINLYMRSYKMKVDSVA